MYRFLEKNGMKSRTQQLLFMICSAYVQNTFTALQLQQLAADRYDWEVSPDSAELKADLIARQFLKKHAKYALKATKSEGDDTERSHYGGYASEIVTSIVMFSGSKNIVSLV
jgi:hypothetical protein